MKIDLSQNVCYDRYLNFKLDPFKYGRHSVCLDVLKERYNYKVEIGYGISELFERIQRYLEYKNYRLVCGENSWLGAEKYSEDFGDALYIANPNGIDGSYLTKEQIYQLASQYKFVIVDEAYGDFCDQSIIHNIPNNVIVLKTLSKSLALPGARFGWALGNHECLDYLESTCPRSCVVGGMETQLEAMLDEIPHHTKRMIETRDFIEENFETQKSAGNYVLYIHSTPAVLNNYIIKDQGCTYRMALTNLDDFKNASFS